MAKLKRVLITGTSKGIGFETALHLARAGHAVIATMRDPKGAPQLDEIAHNERLPIKIYRVDVDDDASVKETFTQVDRDEGPLDALVNNAGIFSINAVEDEPMSRFEAVMNTNFFGAVRCTKACLPAMRKRRSGCIVNITSIAGRIAFAPQAAYGPSKFALECFSEILAQEVRQFGIRVAIVEPGITDTAMATSNLPQFTEGTIYPHGARMHAMFAFTAQTPISPVNVAQRIREIIEGNDDRLRYPVGSDALPYIGWRASMSDERWVATTGTPDDETFFAAIERDIGLDMRPVPKK